MNTWELIPKVDRPDAQVLLTLPNSEMEYVEGFRYQDFRFVVREGACSTLVSVGPPHTRYRYRPRQLGTYRWLHRTPPGGTLEQGAFTAEALPEPAPLLPLFDSGTIAGGWELPTLTLSAKDNEQPGMQAIERVLDNLSSETRCVRVVWEEAGGAARMEGEPDLVREWLLDALLGAAEARRAAVLLRLPSPAGPDTLQLHATLHRFICRYAPLPALAAWELGTTVEIAEAAVRFLRSYDPYHVVIIAEEGELHV